MSDFDVEPFPGSALHPDGDRFILARNATDPTVPEGGGSDPQRLILVQNFFEELRQVGAGLRPLMTGSGASCRCPLGRSVDRTETLRALAFRCNMPSHPSGS